MLNDKQLAFCREYPKDNNATQAAIRAGYSEKTAHSMASRMLTRADIKKQIEKNIQKWESKSSVTPEWIVEKLELIANMGTGAIESDVVVKDSQGKGITQTYSQKLKKADLQAAKGALELLGRVHGIFNDKLKVEGEVVQRVINVNPTKGNNSDK